MQQYSQRDELALQIINLAKAEILLDNHFLAEAVGTLIAEPAPMEGSLSAPKELRQFTTDGHSLGFDAGAVIQNFRLSEGKAPTHDLLHSVMHCVFLHPFVGRFIDGQMWSLAADMAAERAAAEVLGPREAPRGPSIMSVLAQVEQDMGCHPTAEKIYHQLKAGRWSGLVPLWEVLFASDEHMTWYVPPNTDDGFAPGEGERTDNPTEDMSTTRGPEDAQGGEEQQPQGAPQLDQDEQGSGAGDNQAQPLEDGSDDGVYETDEQRSSAEGEERRLAQEEFADDQGDHSQAQRDQADSPSQEFGDARPSEANGSCEDVIYNEEAAEPGDTPSSGSAEVRSQGEGQGRGKDSYASQRAGMNIRQLPAQEEARLAALRDQWTKVATDLMINLETFSQERASAISCLRADLELMAAKPLDYRVFLRQFAALGEVMRVSDDDFDYVYYTYGMRLYGNLPLIEPLEFREEKRIREFVIVIDTSGSVQGDIVRTFVDTTFDILKDVESFHEQVNLRIIQCDAAVQSDDKISSLDELMHWGRAFRIFGGGGTDFRPAFQYVDSLIDQGEFDDLGGLIYFTDGWGTYPEWTPRYRTAFVFYDENYRPENVPPWAIQAVMDEAALEKAKGPTAALRESRPAPPPLPTRR